MFCVQCSVGRDSNKVALTFVPFFMMNIWYTPIFFTKNVHQWPLWWRPPQAWRRAVRPHPPHPPLSTRLGQLATLSAVLNSETRNSVFCNFGIRMIGSVSWNCIMFLDLYWCILFWFLTILYSDHVECGFVHSESPIPDHQTRIQTSRLVTAVFRPAGRLRRESAVLPGEWCCTPRESAADSRRRRPSGLKTAVTLLANSQTENARLVVWSENRGYAFCEFWNREFASGGLVLRSRDPNGYSRLHWQVTVTSINLNQIRSFSISAPSNMWNREWILGTFGIHHSWLIWHLAWISFSIL